MNSPLDVSPRENDLLSTNRILAGAEGEHLRAAFIVVTTIAVPGEPDVGATTTFTTTSGSPPGLGGLGGSELDGVGFKVESRVVWDGTDELVPLRAVVPADGAEVSVSFPHAAATRAATPKAKRRVRRCDTRGDWSFVEEVLTVIDIPLAGCGSTGRPSLCDSCASEC